MERCTASRFLLLSTLIKVKKGCSVKFPPISLSIVCCDSINLFLKHCRPIKLLASQVIAFSLSPTSLYISNVRSQLSFISHSSFLPSFKPTVHPPQTWRERVANTAWSDATGFCRPPGTRDPTPGLSTGSIHPRQLGCSRKFRRGRPITPSSRASALGHGVSVATCTQPVSPRTRPKGPTKTSHLTSSRITAWSLGRSWTSGPVWTILGSLPRG